jgi:tetratricopeptide (TPR) repeat protein
MDVQLLDGNSMKKALETGADEISVALSKINSRSANAWSADDQAKINQAVEDSIGFHELDVQVMRYVRDRIAKQARVLYEQNKGNVALISGYANLLTDQGKLAEAEQFYRKALDLRVKECGQEHVLTLLAMNDLATLLKRREQLNEAEQLYGIALAHLEALKPDHQYKYLLLTVIHNMATLFKQQKRLDEAEQLFLRALEGRETSLGPDHLSTLKTISNLASLFRDRSQLDDAEDLCRRALDGYELKLGADHPHTLNSIHSLAKVLGKRGKMKEAETQYRRALAGRERRLGSHHQATITTVHELATLLMKLGPEQRQEADELLTRAMLAKVILDGRRSVLTTLHNLAKLRATDRHERKAVEVKILQELVDRLEIKRGLQHLDTLTAVSHLANLHAQHGDLDKAEQHLRRVLRGREVELGEFHSSTISAVQWLADALSEQGKLEEAKELYQRALAGVDQSLEFIDPDATGSIANRLAQVLRRLGMLPCGLAHVHSLIVLKFARSIGCCGQAVQDGPQQSPSGPRSARPQCHQHCH